MNIEASRWDLGRGRTETHKSRTKRGSSLEET